MGRRLRSQRLGSGRPLYRAGQRGIADASYMDLDDRQKQGIVLGEVIGLCNDPARSSVLAEVLSGDGSTFYTIAAEGIVVSEVVEAGKRAELRIGSIMPLGSIPEGCPVFNIEKTPGDGGALVRASGLYALVMTRDAGGVHVKMPSGKTAMINPGCRATVGCAAAGGRPEKPFVKAGNKYHAMHARGKPYPKVRGVAMNPVDHPFGGSQHHVGKSKSTSRHAPAGRKVGAIASRRTGRRKR